MLSHMEYLLASITGWAGECFPRGFKYPIFKDSGPKYHEGYGFGTRDLRYWLLGPSGYYVIYTIPYYIIPYYIVYHTTLLGSLCGTWTLCVLLAVKWIYVEASGRQAWESPRAGLEASAK